MKINPILPGREGVHSCVKYKIGIAKRLRAIGAAAPVVAAAGSGFEKEENVSVKYGGNATEAAVCLFLIVFLYLNRTFFVDRG